MYWWMSAEESRSKGTRGCKGYIDFFENVAEAEDDESFPSRFRIIPGKQNWIGNTFSGNQTNRSMDFDTATYSQYDRGDWVAAINEHIDYGRSRQRRDIDPDSRLAAIKTYWEKHGLVTAIADALDRLNDARPDFPLQFLVSHFGKQSIEQDPRCTGAAAPEAKSLRSSVKQDSKSLGIAPPQSKCLRQSLNSPRDIPEDSEKHVSFSGNFKVLAVDVDDACLPILTPCGKVDKLPRSSESDLAARIGTYDALVCRSSMKLTGAILNAAHQMKIVAVAQAGTDNIPVAACAGRGMRVCNSPKGTTITIAEHTIALILCLMRKLSAADRSMRSGRWMREPFVGHQLHGSTLGLLGFGNIAVHIARVAIAFGMSVLAYDPYASADLAKSVGVTLFSNEADLPHILKNINVLSVHIPLTPKTKGMIAQEQIAMMKQGSFIVSCAHGGVVNEEDVCQALVTHHLAGAALDVFENEQSFILSGSVPSNWCLLNAPNTVLTPHISALTAQAREAVAEDAAQQVADFLLKNLEPKYAVTRLGPSGGRLVDARPAWIRDSHP